MKDFLSYLPFIIIFTLIIYFFYPYLIAIAVVLLIIYFYKEIAGLTILAQILAIPYVFFTDSNFRSCLFEIGLFLGGIFLLTLLSERKAKNKENNETDSSVAQPEQVVTLEVVYLKLDYSLAEYFCSLFCQKERQKTKKTMKLILQ